MTIDLSPERKDLNNLEDVSGSGGVNILHEKNDRRVIRQKNTH